MDLFHAIHLPNPMFTPKISHLPHNGFFSIIIYSMPRKNVGLSWPTLGPTRSPPKHDLERISSVPLLHSKVGAVLILWVGLAWPDIYN